MYTVGQQQNNAGSTINQYEADKIAVYNRRNEILFQLRQIYTELIAATQEHNYTKISIIWQREHFEEIVSRLFGLVGQDMLNQKTWLAQTVARRIKEQKTTMLVLLEGANPAIATVFILEDLRQLSAAISLDCLNLINSYNRKIEALGGKPELIDQITIPTLENINIPIANQSYRGSAQQLNVLPIILIITSILALGISAGFVIFHKLNKKKKN